MPDLQLEWLLIELGSRLEVTLAAISNASTGALHRMMPEAEELASQMVVVAMAVRELRLQAMATNEDCVIHIFESC